MNDVRTLRDLYAYNAWANAQVFGVCRDIDQAQMEAEAPGTFGTIAETLKHLVGVEDVYLLMLRTGSLDTAFSREEYFDHDLAWFAERSSQLGEKYAALLESAEPAFYDEPFKVPWFDFALTRHDGLLQVLSHSAQHRAQVLSVLGEREVKVPDVDFVLYVGSKGNTAG